MSLKSVILMKGHRVNSWPVGSVEVLHNHHSNIDSIHLMKQMTAKVCHPRSDGGLTQTCLLLSLVSRNVQLPHVEKQGPYSTWLLQFSTCSQHCNLHIGATIISVNSNGSKGLENLLNCYKWQRLTDGTLSELTSKCTLSVFIIKDNGLPFK